MQEIAKELIADAMVHPSFLVMLDDLNLDQDLALVIWIMGYIAAVYDMENGDDQDGQCRNEKSNI